jgi:hypothetical protein
MKRKVERDVERGSIRHDGICCYTDKRFVNSGLSALCWKKTDVQFFETNNERYSTIEFFD